MDRSKRFVRKMKKVIAVQCTVRLLNESPTSDCMSWHEIVIKPIEKQAVFFPSCFKPNLIKIFRRERMTQKWSPCILIRMRNFPHIHSVWCRIYFLTAPRYAICCHRIVHKYSISVEDVRVTHCNLNIFIVSCISRCFLSMSPVLHDKTCARMYFLLQIIIIIIEFTGEILNFSLSFPISSIKDCSTITNLVA